MGTSNEVLIFIDSTRSQTLIRSKGKNGDGYYRWNCTVRWAGPADVGPVHLCIL